MTVLIWPFFDVEHPSPSSPPPENHMYRYSSATNGLRLLKFSVHIYGFTLGGFWTYCDHASGCRPAQKADGRKLLNSRMHFI